jgi:hypothetical protein
MEVAEVTPELYNTIINKPSQVFNSVEFSVLNANKCEKVHYLVFKDSKYRLGIILGVRNNTLFSPFSASFGGFEAVSEDIKLHQIDLAIEVFLNWMKNKGYIGVSILCPPFFYHKNFYAKITNCLYRAGFEIKNVEINYHFQTENLDEIYLEKIWHNARKNLKKALTFPLSITKIDPKNGKEAYDVIEQNRNVRGFPIRLSYNQLKDTENILPIDYFLVRDSNQDIAAAIVFHLSSEVVRVVYWGDLPQFSEHKTMNFLSFKIFQHYKELGVKYIDIGHSTVDSVPNHGLCEFKESIGCSMGLLNSYYKGI